MASGSSSSSRAAWTAARLWVVPPIRRRCARLSSTPRQLDSRCYSHGSHSFDFDLGKVDADVDQTAQPSSSRSVASGNPPGRPSGRAEQALADEGGRSHEASDSALDSWQNGEEDAVRNNGSEATDEAVVSKLASKTAVTLADVDALRPQFRSAKSLERMLLRKKESSRASSFASRLSTMEIQAFAAKKTWEDACQVLTKAFTKGQLVKLLKEANLLRKSMHYLAKPGLVAALASGYLRIEDPNERSEPVTEVPETTFPLTRSELLLLLADDSRRLTRLRHETSIALSPQVHRDDAGAIMSYQLVARIPLTELHGKVEEALQEFKTNICKMTVPIDVPTESISQQALTSIAMSSGVPCIAGLAPTEEASPGASAGGSGDDRGSIELQAVDMRALGVLQNRVLVHQAELLKPRPRLFSYVPGTRLGVTPAQSSGKNIARYAFMPHLGPHPHSWTSAMALGGEKAGGFRLTLAKEPAGLSWRSSEDKPGHREQGTLVDTAAASDTELREGGHLESLQRHLDDHVLPGIESLESFPSPPQTQHSAYFGSAAFPSIWSGSFSESQNDVSIMQRLLGQPLAGTWPISTALEWLAREQTTPGNPSPTPVWLPSKLPDGRETGDGLLPGQLAASVLKEARKEDEFLRLSYRLAEGSRKDAEPWALLEIDLNEAMTKANEAYGAEPRLVSKYSVRSTRLTTERTADVLAPDHPVDMRFVTARYRECHQANSSVCEQLDDFLARLGRHEDAMLLGINTKITAKSGAAPLKHPRLLKAPAPLAVSSTHTVRPSPPMELWVDGLRFSLIDQARIGTLSWPLLVDTGTRVTKRGAEDVFFVCETVLSDRYGANKTTHRIDFIPQQGAEAANDWQDRVENVVARVLDKVQS